MSGHGCSEAEALSAQGSVEIPIPGGALELWRCGTELLGQWT